MLNIYLENKNNGIQTTIQKHMVSQVMPQNLTLCGSIDTQAFFCLRLLGLPASSVRSVSSGPVVATFPLFFLSLFFFSPFFSSPFEDLLLLVLALGVFPGVFLGGTSLCSLMSCLNTLWAWMKGYIVYPSCLNCKANIFQAIGIGALTSDHFPWPTDQHTWDRTWITCDIMRYKWKILIWKHCEINAETVLSHTMQRCIKDPRALTLPRFNPLILVFSSRICFLSLSAGQGTM